MTELINLAPHYQGKRPAKPLWNLYRDGVTQGLLANFLSCPEITRLSMVEGWAGTGSTIALDFGNVVHEVLDHFYTACRDMGDTGGVSYEEFGPLLMNTMLHQQEEKLKLKMAAEGKLSESAHRALIENFGMAKVVLLNYLKQYPTDHEQFEWVSLEEKFDVRFDPKYYLGIDRPVIRGRGKRDGVFRVDKRLNLFETKTKGVISEDAILDSITYNLQVCFYLWSMWKDYKEMPQGVLYNIIRRPGLKRKVSEEYEDFLTRVDSDIKSRPDHYFIRYNVTFLPSEIKEWEGEFVKMMGQLIRWYDGEFHYRNSNNCQVYGGCKFLSICGRNDTTFFQKRPAVFPELED